MMLILGLCLIAVLLCYVALSAHFLYWKKRGVPHPPVSLIFGNMKDVALFRKSIGQVYHEIYSNYPTLPYVGFYKMHNPGILLRDPELIKNILTTHFSSFANNDFDVDVSYDPLIAKNPFVATGEQWKISRSQLTPSFTSKQMKYNYALMQPVCDKLVAFLEDPVIANGGIEIKDLCHKFMMEVVALCAMGLEAKSFESANTDFITYARKLLSPGILTTLRFLLFFLVPWLAKYLLRVRLVPESSANYFGGIIQQTLEYRKTNKVVKNDFLNSMIELQTKLGKEKLSNTDITGHALSFFTDGFETSAILLSFALYELGENIKFQEQLRLEIEDKVEQEKRDIDYDFVQELTFLNSFINETLRLFTPTMFLPKKCTKTFELPPLTANGKPVVIDPETSIAVPAYSIHRDEKNFSEPNTFNPLRFEYNSDVIKKGIFLPFGEGPRTCIGQRFALAQVKAALICVVLNFDVRVNKKTVTPIELDPKHIFATAKGGLWLNFVKRKKID